MFRMIGYGDNIGSGFPTILSAWGEENWRKPDLRQNEELHQVELHLWMISLMPPECTAYLKSVFGWVYDGLDKEEQILLGTAYLENGVTNSRMQSILELGSVEIGHILASLVDRKLLLADKNGRWSSYRLNPDYQIPPEQIQLPFQQEIPKFKIEADQRIYEYIKANGFITSKQALDITKITTPQGVSVALQRLTKAGLIQKKRVGRQFIYSLKTDP